MSSSTEKQSNNYLDHGGDGLDRQHTAGGHENDRSQPPLPVVHRSFANPSPLDIFLISIYGLYARGIQSPNVMVGMLVFFGGVCQFLAGIMEFVTGNTFGATVFTSYGAFNLSYAMIYLPGSGIIAAYTDPITNTPTSEFKEAVAIYLWVWLIVTVIYTVAAMRSTWILFLDLLALDICLLLLAVGFMLGNEGCMKAGYAFGVVVCGLSFWAGTAGLWVGITPIKVPVFEMV
ncbi:GPR1/FUN34/yaaH family-domain-containing protein [Aspergillus venezuelensis]